MTILTFPKSRRQSVPGWMAEATLASAIDAVVIIDHRNNVIFFNRAAEVLWGYSAKEVLGRNVRMLVPERFQAGHDEYVNSNRRTGHDKIVGSSRDLKLIRRDGREVSVSLALSKIRVGKSWAYAAFVRNISQEYEALDGLLGRVKHCAESLMTACAHMNEAIGRVSEGTTRQASAAQQASASTEQMTANIRQCADNATQTETIAGNSLAQARSAAQVVEEAVSAMDAISGKIAIVQDIARQTDLLALNAGVEAARAGIHGRGFAIVATEVRRLAERSQEAANEIIALSRTTAEASGKARAELNALIPEFQRTSDLVQEISAATNEQRVGSEQINTAINQLDQVIQANALTAKRAESATDTLTDNAHALMALIEGFRDEDGNIKRKDNGPATPESRDRPEIPKRPA
ncbi:methyl-accepting chemotaxis protein [Paracoccus methylarcula]|uniref:PAS domain S-box protein n=1 Tax=Paracoccus methylarcula TaxID=72022 RepID=A0A422QTX9_9RHOB|nr:methyl-accepting chemotaxis protein [Paracoccus methylarcula]RNF33455.1 PAS domain S-box protein [Paracoccus methylarcula]